MLKPNPGPFAYDAPWLNRGPARMALGLMTPRRKLASAAYLPGPKARASLLGGKIPYSHVMDFTLSATQSLDDRIVVAKRFILVAIMATASQGDGTFRTQFYHLVGRQQGFRFSKTGENDQNVVGAATDAWMFRMPYPMPEQTVIQCRVQNLSSNPNNVQVVLYGLMD